MCGGLARSNFVRCETAQIRAPAPDPASRASPALALAHNSKIVNHVRAGQESISPMGPGHSLYQPYMGLSQSRGPILGSFPVVPL